MLAKLLVILVFISESFCKDQNPPLESIKPSYVYVSRIDKGDSYMGETYDIYWDTNFYDRLRLKKKEENEDEDESHESHESPEYRESLSGYTGNGHFDVKKRINKWTGELKILTCGDSPAKVLSLCDLVMKYTYDGCKSLEAEGEWYSQYIQNITPKLKCPVEPGRYTLNNMTAAHFGNPKLALGDFYLFLTGVDENGDKRFLMRVVLVGARDNNEIRAVYGVPRSDDVPEDEDQEFIFKD